jgi:hypothetical protein
MKNKLVRSFAGAGLVLAVMTLISCATVQALLGLPHWATGQFVNTGGDRTGTYYIQYSEKIPAVYTRARSSEQIKTTLGDVSFSKSEGLTFTTPYGNSMFPDSKSEVELTVTLPDGTVKTFSGISPELTKIVIPYSDDLAEALLVDGAVIIFSGRYTGTQISYQFTLPAGFSQAYQGIVGK